MGNSNAAEKAFREADDDADGRLNLQELMQIDQIDQLLSPLMLFRLDADRAGGVTKEEFTRLIGYLQERAVRHLESESSEKDGKEGGKEVGKDPKDRDHLRGFLKRFTHRGESSDEEEPQKRPVSRIEHRTAPSLKSRDALKSRSTGALKDRSVSSSKVPPDDQPGLTSSSQVVVSLDESIANQLELDRDHETPMIIGGSLAHPAAPLFAPFDSTEEDQKRSFCQELFGTHQGRQEFVAWLWKLADMHHHDRVGPEELQLVLEALKHDGINLAHLSFTPSVTTPLNSESENEGTSSSSDDDSDSNDEKKFKVRSSIIEYKGFRCVVLDAPTSERLGSVLAHLERHHITHIVRLCNKSTYEMAPFTERGIKCVALVTGFPDQEVPTVEFLEQWRGIVKEARKKHGAVAVHGMTGGSRAPVLACVSLIEFGMEPAAAIKVIRKKRPGAINSRQELWLRRFKKIIYKDLAECSGELALLSGHAAPLHPGDSGLDHATVDRIISEFDTEGLGYLSKDEFMVFANLIVHAYKAVAEGRHTIGKYLVGEKLGEGSVGTVRLATHLDSGEKKAIKIIARGRVSDMSKLDIEAKAMMMLRHPNIVHLCEVLENDENVFFVMDLCSGGSLSDYLALRPCSEQLARTYFRQLVQGVVYCHSQGVAHRDLKVENLLLDNDGHLKITDFGQAMIFPEDWDVCNTSVVGTAYHLTPEQIQGLGYSGEKKDTWSVGIILFHLIVGRPPFWTTNLQILIEDIKNVRFEAPSYLSPEVKELIASLLAQNPDARLPLSSALTHDWLKGPSQDPELSIYRFPLGDLARIFGDRPSSVIEMIKQWEAHWKVTFHKSGVVGVPVHHTSPSDPGPPDCLCRAHCFSPEQDGLKFTVSLCVARSDSRPNSPASSARSPESPRPPSRPGSPPIGSSSGGARTPTGHHSPSRGSSPMFATTGNNSSPSNVFLTPSELCPTGLLLRFDLFHGSVWNFFKTIHNLAHSIENLAHPFPPPTSKTSRRNQLKPESRKGEQPRSLSRPSSPHHRAGELEQRIPINPTPLRHDSKKDLHGLKSSLHSESAYDIPISDSKDRDPHHSHSHSHSHISHSSKRSASPHSRRRRSHRDTPDPDAQQTVASLSARLHDQEEQTRALHKLIQQQDEAIRTLQRHVDTLKTDMFRMQNFQSQLMGQAPTEPHPHS